MKVYFAKFNKQIDSTARLATGSFDENLDCQLKDSVSVTSPSLIIHRTDFNIGYNYCYIPMWKRYYFVQNYTMHTGGIWQVDLTIDVLATYRTEILSSTLYVTRSASSYNLKLVDDTWTHTTDFTETVTSVAFPSYDSTGSYIVTVVNNSTRISANPASQMYLMDATNLTALLAEMFDVSSYSNLDDLTQTYFNPGQYITSCRWLPFSYAYLTSLQDSTVESVVRYGWYEASNASAITVTSYGLTKTFTLTLGTYTDWTDRDSNWTRYALFVPGFGVTEVDAAFSGQTLTGKISIDFNTCQANLMLTTGTGQIASQLSGKIGAEVALNQVGGSIDIPTSVGGLISKGIQFAGATAAGGGLRSGAKSVVEFFKAMGSANAAAYGGSAAAVQEHLTNALNGGQDVAAAAADAAKQTLLNPTVSTTGADGARYTIIDNHTIYLYRRKYSHYNPAVAKLGGVCNQVKTLSTLSGYTQVANGLIQMTGTAEERNAITSLLEGGFVIA